MANELSKIKMPTGTEYAIKDATARNEIEQLKTAMTGKVTPIGTTTTALTDQATTNPIKINNADVTAVAGNLVYYNKKEFIFDGTKWIELGDLSSLGSLAYKNSATGKFTPAGSVSQPTFNGTESSVTVTATENTSGAFQPGGTVSKPSFTGASMTSTGKFTPAGNITISQATSGTTNFTPAGTVAAPTITITESESATTTIKNPTSKTVATAIATAAPGSTAPANAVTLFSVSGETLTLNQIGYTTGASISTSDVSVKKGAASYTATATAPKFTGTATVISASFAGTQGNVSVSGTTTGDVSQPTFTGKKYNLSGKTTASGTVTKPTFTGTEGNVTVS